MKRNIIAMVFAASCVPFIVGAANAENEPLPRKMNYQAVLQDALGNPVTTQKTIIFRFYDSLGVLPIWADTVIVHPDSSGQFDCAIAVSDPGAPSDNTPSGHKEPDGDNAARMGIQVGSDPEMTPRTDLGSVLFSQFAACLTGGTVEADGGGLSISDATVPAGSSHAIRMAADSGRSSVVFLAPNGDTISSFVTSSTGAFNKSPSNPFSISLNSSRSNAFRVVTVSDDHHNQISMTDSLGATTVFISDTMATFRAVGVKGTRGYSSARFYIDMVNSPCMVMTDSLGNTNVRVTDSTGGTRFKDGLFGTGTQSPYANLHVNGTTYLNGVTTIANGGRIQSEANGGVRILGDQGNTPATPAIGFFSTNGVDDGGGGNGIYRPASNVMAFATGSTERMRITSGGNLAIGTSTSTERLTVNGNICATGTITGNSGGCGVSDARFKKNVTTLDNGLGLVLRLRGVRYDWDREHFPERNFSDARQVGFIAQEIKEVMPELVTRMSDGYYAVDYGRLAPVLVEAIKELKAKTDRIAELEKKVDQLAVLQTKVTELQELVQKLAPQNPHPGTTAQVER